MQNLPKSNYCKLWREKGSTWQFWVWGCLPVSLSWWHAMCTWRRRSKFNILYYVRLKKFTKLLPLLTSRVFLHKTCFRSVMLYGGETWSLKESDISRIDRIDMQIVWWMCHVSLRNRKSSEELRNRLGIANMTNVFRQTRLRWFGHVEQMDKENPVNKCRFIEVGGQIGKITPSKNWTQLIN